VGPELGRGPTSGSGSSRRSCRVHATTASWRSAPATRRPARPAPSAAEARHRRTSRPRSSRCRSWQLELQLLRAMASPVSGAGTIARVRIGLPGCLAACRTVPATARGPPAPGRRARARPHPTLRSLIVQARLRRPRRPGSPCAARWLNGAPQPGPSRSATRTVPNPRGALGGRREHQARGPDGRGRWSAPGQAR
jgi:hypothetical protein